MGYQNPVGGVPDPYEKYRVEGLGGYSSGGGPPGEEPPKDKRGLATRLIQVLQKAIDSFLERLGGSPPHKAAIEASVSSLKTLLEILKQEDKSQDVRFLNDLSKSWNEAIQNSLEYNGEALLIFKLFVKKILHYPEGQPHTFGYYLIEYAGQKWVPFPYMELVQKIHKEHEKSPATSPLTEWTRLLGDVINLLHEK